MTLICFASVQAYEVASASKQQEYCQSFMLSEQCGVAVMVEQEHEGASDERHQSVECNEREIVDIPPCWDVLCDGLIAISGCTVDSALRVGGEV